MKSTVNSQAHFARVPGADIPRSVFNRSSGYKTAFDAGYLIPFFVDEVLPGDTMSLKTSFLSRLATPIFPYMDNVWMDFHYFFVPNRLVHTNWEKLQGAQDNPGDSVDFLCPQLDATAYAGGFTAGSIHDYMGLPTGVILTQVDMPNAFVFRGYRLIWNEWFRDENLQNSVTVEKDDGPDNQTYVLLKRGRRKDYFTSALPWPQKGAAVSLPLGTRADIKGFGKIANTTWDGPGGENFYETGGSAPLTPGAGTYVHVDDTGANRKFGIIKAASGYPDIYADLSTATAATINSLRQAFQLQRLFERDARSGTRYVEALLARFGVVSPDFRLQRPEYLGGSSEKINVNPVPQTSVTAATPQGNLAAFGSVRGLNGFNHSFVEHGHVIGLVSVRADQTYQQGMHKMWNRRTRYDFYEPVLSHLGEQAVLMREIYTRAAAADNDDVWGYQERWAEYRYRPSQVTGPFRSNAAGSLDAWHLAVDFSAPPTLAGFVLEDPPIDRVIAVPTEPHFIFDSYTEIRHARPIPTYSVPGLIDHF